LAQEKNLVKNKSLFYYIHNKMMLIISDPPIKQIERKKLKNHLKNLKILAKSKLKTIIKIK
jgi:hypothetical protein